ncbi:MAG TPA: NAD-dependent epimerase/dehydratase family protein [Firmicutes bacterium]|nr:NAD-dependent epimerase/dehydratase family protein [Bacillota bacterium]
MKNKNLKNKRILIFGGSGFLGSNLIHYLIKNGAVNITAVTEKIDERVEYNLSELKVPINILEADIRYEKEIENLVKDKDIIYNFAAHSGAVNSTEKPFLNLDINGKGMLNILTACVKNNTTARIIFISSRLVYGKVSRLPVKETDPVNPGNIYSIHKLLGEYYMRLYSELYGLNTLILRLTNPYGPRQPFWQSEYGILNYFIYRAMQGEDLIVFGDGKQLRDYIYIDDVSELLVKSGLEKIIPGSIFNLGSGNGTCFIDMAKSVCRIVGKGNVKKVPWPPLFKKVETGDFVPDISNISSMFNWSPVVPLEDGIERTVEFIKTHPKFLEKLT